MRRRATHCLCFVWATTCPLFAHAKDSPPPEYVRPAAVLRKFKAARAKVVFVDARPPEKDPAQTEQIDPKSDPLSENVLRPALEKLVEKALGQDNRELVFRVKLVEGREVLESPPTVRAVVDVFVERDGQTLGFTYQFVIAPTEDLAPLSGPHFGLRVYIPIDLHNRHVRCPSPLPCEGKILPWSGS